MKPGKLRRAIGVATIAAVGGGIAAGLWVLDSPAEERSRRLDARRVGDLDRIAGAVDLYWTRHGRLPVSLDTLAGEPGVYLTGRDPRTGEPYEYRALGDSTYQVCASFERATPASQRDPRPDFWSHGTGRQCFALAARRQGR
ncbi:MAG: hypothetical protein AB1505_26885 [Candidatus Latescibacterota bacterium]